MLRAMDSGVAGLRAHQNKLDVISNNIANVNTFGFKAQTFSFKDTMYQTTVASSQGNTATTATTTTAKGSEVSGGLNASQYGYGSLTGSIATDFTSSTPTFLGGFSACVNGAGFFVTSASNDERGVLANNKTANADMSAVTSAMKNANFAYTRVGQFSVDSNGYIVDSNGNFVYGFRPDTYTDPSYYGGTEAGEQKIYALRAPNTNVVIKEVTATDPGKVSTKAEDYTGTGIQLKSVEIGNDGVIKAVVEAKKSASDTSTTETTIIIGKVAVASFQNQGGLTKAGNNTFNAKSGDNTGAVCASEPATGATPSLMAGYVEGSNTDLAKEFSDMITTQRGFQANSKIITVSDEILQELVNMKR
ncbi:flagellar hook-basal body protein [Lachnospiraceae bacterium JC7]|nr:flagellar hook-basal body protein [Lachnospiraceae bacterium JC7]